MNLNGTKKKNQVSNVNIFEQQEFLKKIEGGQRKFNSFNLA